MCIIVYQLIASADVCLYKPLFFATREELLFWANLNFQCALHRDEYGIEGASLQNSFSELLVIKSLLYDEYE